MRPDYFRCRAAKQIRRRTRTGERARDWVDPIRKGEDRRPARDLWQEETSGHVGCHARVLFFVCFLHTNSKPQFRKVVRNVPNFDYIRSQRILQGRAAVPTAVCSRSAPAVNNHVSRYGKGKISGMTNEEQRAHWDLKYEEGLPSLTEPDPFFISAYETFVAASFTRPGMALDLAGGLGRHALWLASRGWQVTVVDVSDVAIGKLSQSAQERNVKLELQVGDASKFKFQPVRFGLIVLFYHADRDLFPKMVSALSPGGLLLCKLSVRWTSSRTLNPLRTAPLVRDELPSLAPELEVLYHHERPVRDRGVVEFVGKKAEK